MSVEVANEDQQVEEVAEALAEEFSGVLPRPVVSKTVLDARRDLEGQIVPEALGEMLHQLARHRLNTLGAVKKTAVPGRR